MVTPRPIAGALAALTLFLADEVGWSGGGPLGAQQTATLRVEENLRAEPQGAILGRLLAGTTLPALEVDGAWVRVELEGWVWTRSLQAADRAGFDLRISASPRENVRAEPSGRILARLDEGALLEKLEEVPGWTRVRRRAWVWGRSVELSEASPSPAESGRGRMSPGGQASPVEWWGVGPSRWPLLAAPDGDTIGWAEPGSRLQVLAREGNWIRVRVEGWGWAPATGAADTVPTGEPLLLTPSQVSAEPDLYKGEVVSWELQFISLERAEKLRTDFYQGEPFLLARATTPGSPFVYVAVPPERLAEVEGLIPLERIRVVGRIRTGAAALTGNPILDLLELTRIRRN